MRTNTHPQIFLGISEHLICCVSLTTPSVSRDQLATPLHTGMKQGLVLMMHLMSLFEKFQVTQLPVNLHLALPTSSAQQSEPMLARLIQP